MATFARSLTLLTVLMLSSPAAPAVNAAPICAIDMGSNSFRRIVGSFENGRYEQRPIEKRTLGVGDDVTRHRRISNAKLDEIGETLGAFKAACDKDGGGPLRYLVVTLGYRVAYERFFAAAVDPARAALAFRDRLQVTAEKTPFMKGKAKLVGVEFAEMAEALFPPAPTSPRPSATPGLN